MLRSTRASWLIQARAGPARSVKSSLGRWGAEGEPERAVGCRVLLPIVSDVHGDGTRYRS
ncbi:hypothetical protein BD311DRAFT_765781 [Dichomitus squalens]|uniref:Uncharacterized protein n=1 Tax=Dichomitus squalens TaxID=114155 RepID=A0A4Q9MEB4_9APHY|nr:hypothetical protein BD311DRAFT_765781 [Dichomitus squalens]